MEKTIRELAASRWRKHIKPHRALGRLEDVAFKLAELREKISPPLKKMRLLLFVADHGVAFRGVSALEPSTTVRLLNRIVAGGTAVNIFCQQYGIELITVDVGSRYQGNLPKGIVDCRVGKGTSDISIKLAMSVDQRDLAIEHGKLIALKAIEDGTDLLGVGEIGIGNTTIAAALTSALLKLPPNETVDRGTGINDKQLKLKEEIVQKALLLHDQYLSDPLDCLCAIGGFEFAAMVGAILTCSETRTPVVIDGYATSISALLAQRISPSVSEVLFWSHLSRERGQLHILKQFNQKPLLDLEMALGEGTGAVLAMQILALCSKVLSDIDCF